MSPAGVRPLVVPDGGRLAPSGVVAELHLPGVDYTGSRKHEAPAIGRGFVHQWSSDQRWITRRSVVV